MTPTLLPADHATGAALRHAILLAPADDDLRRVFADWCDDNGDPARAAFIRAGLAGNVREEEELLQENWRRWVTEGVFVDPGDGYPCRYLDDYPGPRVTDTVALTCRWRAGFVSSVFCSLAKLLRVAPLLFASEPVEYVELDDLRPACTHRTASSLGYYWETGAITGAAVRAAMPEDGWRDTVESRLEASQPLIDMLTGDLAGKWYEDTAAAFAAMSRGIVAWGRKLAKLTDDAGRALQ